MSKRSSSVRMIGVATLYGRFATRVNGSSPLNSGRSADVRASASLLMTVRRFLASGMYVSMVCGSRCATGGSISTAVIVAGFQDGQCQRPQSGADFQHPRIGGDRGLAHDAAHCSGIDDEVLAEFLGRADAGFGCYVTDVGRAEQSPGDCGFLGGCGCSGRCRGWIHVSHNARYQYQPICSERSHALDGLPYRRAIYASPQSICTAPSSR